MPEPPENVKISRYPCRNSSWHETVDFHLVTVRFESSIELQRNYKVGILRIPVTDKSLVVLLAHRIIELESAREPT